VTRVGMESTSDYWKPVFFTLERRGFECLLYNSRQVKAQPGRPKTDLLTELPVIAAGQRVARRAAMAAVALHGRVITTVAGVEPGRVPSESGHAARYRPLALSSSMLCRPLPMTAPTPRNSADLLRRLDSNG
jgi:hypothetical protein